MISRAVNSMTGSRVCGSSTREIAYIASFLGIKLINIEKIEMKNHTITWKIDEATNLSECSNFSIWRVLNLSGCPGYDAIIGLL